MEARDVARGDDRVANPEQRARAALFVGCEPDDPVLDDLAEVLAILRADGDVRRVNGALDLAKARGELRYMPGRGIRVRAGLRGSLQTVAPRACRIVRARRVVRRRSLRRGARAPARPDDDPEPLAAARAA